MPAIELLAPAKDKDTAIAAINYGADAVYMGGPAFGARAQAGNGLADISAVVRHAHLYAAKVYLTVNTLLFDDELEAARSLIQNAYEAGVDAVIVQDAGLFSGKLPPVAMHASTQMHNHTFEKVRFLAQMGVKRAVLPREFSLPEIAAMHAAVPQIELEVFIHGALCVSYSGQCYMSYAVGGRSANRGECAQPCRKKYTLTDERGQVLAQDKYLLALKDLCLKDHLEALMDAGAVSFKIEGRLKNINYVKNAVAFYRQRLDAVLARRPEYWRPSSGREHFDFTPDVARTFNRRFTSYFVDGRSAEITQFETPKALGASLGRVRQSKGGLIRLDQTAEPASGDGLCWLEQDGLKGANVNKVTPQGFELQNVTVIKPGTEVFRSYDHAFIKTLEHSATVRKLPIDVSAAFTGDTLTITALDEDGLAAGMSVTEDFIPAQDAEQAAAGWRKAFGKLGDTPFELKAFESAGDLPFMPMSHLNALRRELMAKLVQVRLETFAPAPVMLNPNAGKYPLAEIDFTGNALNREAAAFYERHGAVVTEPGAESGLNLSGRTVMTTKHCLRYSFGRCPKNIRPEVTAWQLQDDKGHVYTLCFDCKNCQMLLKF